MIFKDLKIGTKQWIGFGAVLLTMACVSFFAIFRMNQLREEIDEVNTYWIPGAHIISELNNDISNLRIHQLEHALNIGTETDRVVDRIVVLFDSINAHMDAYELLANNTTNPDLFDPERARHYSNFDSNWDEYQLQYMALYSAESEEELSRLLFQAGTSYAALSSSLEEIVHINERGSALAASRARENFYRTRNIILGILFFTIVLSSVVAAMLIRSLVYPLRKLEKAARAVAEGNLSVRIAVDSQDEIGNLARSFNEMTASLATAQEQLLVREKMASLGQLTAGIAHEIKNPLNFVNNFAKITEEMAGEFREELESNRDRSVAEVIEPLGDILDDIASNTHRIAEYGARADGIVRSMLLHAQNRTGEKQGVMLHSFLDEHINFVYHGMRSSHPGFNATVHRNFDQKIDTVSLMPQDIGRVIINLLSNAFYAVYQKAQMPEKEAYEPEVTIRTHRSGNRICIDFIDNGTGIPRHLQKKIFEPFFTTKPTGEGTGLGLSLSYEIVTQGHGGKLTLMSEEGEGASFSVELPA